MRDFLTQVFKQHRNRVLFRLPSGETRTYDDVWKASGKQAVEWNRMRLELNQKPILIQRGNSERWLIEALAGWRLNAQVVPLGRHENLLDRIRQVRPAFVSSDYFVSRTKDPVLLPHESPLALFTSGSMGSGKQVVFSSENILTNLEQIDSVVCDKTVNAGDTSFSVLPWSHSYGLTCELLFLLSRGSSLFLPDPQQNLSRQLFWAQPTLLFTVPYFLEKSLRSSLSRPWWIPSGFPKYMLGGRLKSVSVGGAPCASATITDFQTVFQTNVFQGYGMTEASPMISLNTLMDNRYDTVGKPLPGIEIAFSDQNEILVSGQNVSLYLSPDRYLFKDGKRFLKTGDKGYLDADGFLCVQERISDHFKLSNGLFVSSSKIESIYRHLFESVVLLPHPTIHDRCLLVGFSPSHFSVSFKEMEQLGNQHSLLKHEIPVEFYMIDSRKLSEFSTPKFTIKKNILKNYIQKKFLKES